MENLWAWMMIPILYTPLLLSLLLLTPQKHLRTSTKLASTASAQPPAMEACSIAVWSVGFRTHRTPVWWRRLTALPSACRGHRVNKPATCIHVLLSTVSPASVWFVPDNVLCAWGFNLYIFTIFYTGNGTLSLAQTAPVNVHFCCILHCSRGV